MRPAVPCGSSQRRRPQVAKGLDERLRVILQEGTHMDRYGSHGYKQHTQTFGGLMLGCSIGTACTGTTADGIESRSVSIAENITHLAEDALDVRDGTPMCIQGRLGPGVQVNFVRVILRVVWSQRLPRNTRRSESATLRAWQSLTAVNTTAKKGQQRAVRPCAPVRRYLPDDLLCIVQKTVRKIRIQERLRPGRLPHGKRHRL